MTVLHLGALHPVETILVFLIAFGPFVALAFVVIHRRRTQEDDDTTVEETVDDPDGSDEVDRDQRAS